MLTRSIGMRPLPHLIIYVRILLCCNIEQLLRHSKSFGPSAPIAYATSVSPPDEAVAWPGRRCWVLGEVAAWPGAAFLQITFHAGCRHTHFWQGVAWMVRPICAHRAQLQKLIIWLLGIYILEAWKVICRKATLRFPKPISSLPGANPYLCEHKIGVFVLKRRGKWDWKP